jgi:hypothetical protein
LNPKTLFYFIGSGRASHSAALSEVEVRIGNFVALQSGCYLTRGVVIEDSVFCGPRMMTLNDKFMCYGRPTLRFKREAPRILHAARIG